MKDILVKAKHKDSLYYGGDWVSGDPESDPAIALLMRKGLEGFSKGLFYEMGCGAWLSLLSTNVRDITVIHTAYSDYSAFKQNVDHHFLQPHIKSLLVNMSGAIDLDEHMAGFDFIGFRISKHSLVNKLKIKQLNSLLDSKGVLHFYGAIDEGVKSLAKNLQSMGGQVTELAQGNSSRIYELKKSEFWDCESPQMEKRYLIKVGEREFDIWSLPGVFSYKSADTGTLLLLRHLPNLQNKLVLDAGCGSGPILVCAAASGATVFGVDNSWDAVQSSQISLQKNGLTGVVECGFIIPEDHFKKFDLVLSNPPFHQGKKTLVNTGEVWLEHCRRALKAQGGDLYLVANSFLKYGDFGQKYFKKIERLVTEKGFNLWRMTT
jgi:16S rRNA (guanine1207-N2)-methyltransferase